MISQHHVLVVAQCFYTLGRKIPLSMFSVWVPPFSAEKDGILYSIQDINIHHEYYTTEKPFTTRENDIGVILVSH